MRNIVSLIALAALTAAPARAESAWTLLEKGIKAYQKKDYVVAEKTLAAAVLRDAQCHDAYFYLGRIAEKRRDLEKAVAYYGKIDPKWPTFSLAAARLGHIALRAGDLETAVKHFAVHAKDRPTPDAWLQLAAVELDLERFDAAEATLGKVAQLSPGNLELAELRGRLYMETNRVKKALDQYTAIVKKIPIDTTARYLRGACLAQLERKSEALAEWTDVVRRDPYHSMALRSLIEAYAGEPGREDLVAEYEKRLAQLAKRRPKVRSVSGD